MTMPGDGNDFLFPHHKLRPMSIATPGLINSTAWSVSRLPDVNGQRADDNTNGFSSTIGSNSTGHSGRDRANYHSGAWRHRGNPSTDRTRSGLPVMFRYFKLFAVRTDLRTHREGRASKKLARWPSKLPFSIH